MMKNNYDFSKGIKNPYADKLKDGYSVTIHYELSTQDDKNERGVRSKMRKIVAMKRKAGIMLLVLCVVVFGTPVTMGFTNEDTPSSWASVYVNTAIMSNLVPLSMQSNYTQAITRVEFATLSVLLYEAVTGRTVTVGVNPFTDTNDINAIKAARIGVTFGITDTTFDPDTPLTREQAATMLSRLAVAMRQPLQAQTTTFVDADNISPWAVDAVGQVQAMGIMSGVGNNTFAPEHLYTREQSIVTLLRLQDIVLANIPEIVEKNLSSQSITNERLAEMVTSGEIPANVTRLDLAVNSISDVSPLSNLTYLTELNLWGNRVKDVSPLGNLTNLTQLNLWGGEFDDISVLANLTNLVRFSLGDNLQFNGDLSTLRNFTNLTNLGLGDTWHGRMDFSHLEALVNLEYLQLWGAGQLSDLSIIGNLTNLTNLTINGASIEDFAPLGNLTNLTYLDLQHSRINSDISVMPLDRLTNLTELFLLGKQITDIASLSELTNLTHLGLDGNQIVDVSPLSGLTSLTFLSLGRNSIADITPLSELTNLTHLGLGDNQITNVFLLRNLYNLQQLNLEGNQISAAQIRELRAALPRCQIIR